MSRAVAFLALLAAALAAGCNTRPMQAPEKVRVFVSILPQAYFVERLGGEHVEVEVLVGPGQSPHSYEPTPRQMAKLGQAQAYFTIGVPFEKSLTAKVEKSYKNLKIVNTRGGNELPEAERPHEHSGGEHHHGELDPHTWLNPRNVKAMVSNIHEALIELDPANTQGYGKNLAVFQEELDALDAKIGKMLALFEGEVFYVFHPAFGHFAQAYGLRQVAVEAGGKEPSAKQLAALIDNAKRDGVKVIFVQPQFSKGSAEAVARAIGARIEALDPLAKDYMKNLEDMARRIRNALSEKPKRGQEE